LLILWLDAMSAGTGVGKTGETTCTHKLGWTSRDTCIAGLVIPLKAQSIGLGGLQLEYLFCL